MDLYYENPDRALKAGIDKEKGEAVKLDKQMLNRIIAVKLASLGFATPKEKFEKCTTDILLFRQYALQSRVLENNLCPIDKRVQEFLDDALSSTGESVKLPRQSFVVDMYGLARELSLPDSGQNFHNSEVSSYKLDNGVLHNPISDKRTTKGVFHVAEYGLPIPGDKIAVPTVTYARLLKAALKPPRALNVLPFTSNWEKPVESMVSLHIRPLLCPEVPNMTHEKRSEIRFLVPGGLVANLDFVENIFGNAGDPHLPENDAGLDTQGWSGTTGFVVLAPHLKTLKKKELGLPHIDEASEAQKRSGMCWSDPEESYNNGKPFKITLRDIRGIMVTILADNYFGYCKKEVKTQIGLSANIFGLCEEEHAGGALAFKSINLGDVFHPQPRYMSVVDPKEKVIGKTNLNESLKLLGNSVTVHPEGYASDKKYPNIHIMPEDMIADLRTQKASWMSEGKEHSIRILPGHVYIYPNGFKIHVAKNPNACWNLVGTLAEATYCHKPSTVSGGGKSEISKSLTDAVVYGPVFISEFEKDMDWVDRIISRDYKGCFLPKFAPFNSDPSRPILSEERTLGSVIKLLTPDDIYTDEHLSFINDIPKRICAVVFAIKQHYKPEWGKEWRSHFSVDITNGELGHELKVDGREIVGYYLRVGFEKNGTRRNYKLRQDFVPASKVQMEVRIDMAIWAIKMIASHRADFHCILVC